MAQLTILTTFAPIVEEVAIRDNEYGVARNGLYCRSAVVLGVRTFGTGSLLILIVAVPAGPTVVVVFDGFACGMMRRAPILSAIRLPRI